MKEPSPQDDPGDRSEGGAAVLCEAMDATDTGQSGLPISERARPELIGLAVVAVLIGTVTRFVTRSPLWLDEALSVNISQLPLGELTEALRHDGHPPLYYVLLHGWTSIFGTSDVAVRSMSGVFGLMTIPVVWLLARRKGGPTLGWIAVAVIAVSPFAVRYSDEARMYALVILLVTVGWLLIDDLVDRGLVTPWRIGTLTLVGAALLYSHYWSIWLLVALGLASLWRVWRAADSPSRRPWLAILLAIVLSGVLFLPWLPSMLYQSSHTGTPWASPSRPTSALALMLDDYGGGDYAEQTLGAALVAVAFLMGVFGYAIDRRTSGLDLRTRREFRGAASIAAGTFLIGCAVSIVSHSAFATRYTAVIFPIVIVTMAAGLSCFAGRWIRFTVVAGACALLSVGALWNTVSNRTQVRAAADLVAASARPGDIVVFCPDQLAPAGTRVMPEDVTLVSYPDYGDGRFVDWVDYGERNRASDPAAFATRVLAEAGPDHAVSVVWSDSYKTFEGKCTGLIDALAATRSPQALLVEDGDRYFEHVSLTRFAPPR